jgi:hypothetical protein
MGFPQRRHVRTPSIAKAATRIDLALAVADCHLGDMVQARQRIERAARVLGQMGDEGLLATAQVCLGRIKLEGGEPESALWAFEAALRLARQRGSNLREPESHRTQRDAPRSLDDLMPDGKRRVLRDRDQSR